MPLPDQIAPSILSADFARLGAEVDAVVEAGADMIHFDVMDYHYVPNLTIGPLVCEALRKHGVTVPIDVHLMVTPVDGLINDFAKAGASSITFHPEATQHVDRSLQLARDLGCKNGLVLNPATPLSALDHVLDKIDMACGPGSGGSLAIGPRPGCRSVPGWTPAQGAPAFDPASGSRHPVLAWHVPDKIDVLLSPSIRDSGARSLSSRKRLEKIRQVRARLDTCDISQRRCKTSANVVLFQRGHRKRFTDELEVDGGTKVDNIASHRERGWRGYMFQVRLWFCRLRQPRLCGHDGRTARRALRNRA